MYPVPDTEKLKRFLDNVSDYVDAEEVYRYLCTNEEALDNVMLMEDLSDNEVVVTTSFKRRQRLLKQILYEKTDSPTRTMKWAVAASLLCAMILGITFFVKKDKRVTQLADAETYITNKTEGVLNYTLPDSSKISLRPGTILKFKRDFTTNRIITVLKGSSYFHVSKDTARPFQVLSNGVSTTVTGTQFWVQYFQDSSTQISLNEGAVFIHSVDPGFKMDTVFLTPGQTCLINKSTGAVVVSGGQSNGESSNTGSATFDNEKNTNYTSNAIVWTTNDISFVNASLQNVFVKLKNRYGVHIIAEDESILQATMTGRILYNDSLNILIKSISEINQLSYEIRKDSVFLRKKP